MNRSLLRPVGHACLSLALASLLFACARHSEPPSPYNEVFAGLTVEIHSVLDSTTIPAISISVVQSSQVAWSEAFGVSNLSTRALATRDTYFSTGSTLKPVTATALMQLVEQGYDTFNELVRPELAIEGADDVTLRHLVTHHAGLEGPVDIVPLWGREHIKSPVETIQETTRVGPPGVEYSYCNVCYTLVGHVIEQVSGIPYDEFVAERVLRPLGSELTVATLPTPGVIEQLALPYDEEDGRAVPLEQIRTNVFAAGDAYLRPSDMAAFLAAIANGGRYQDHQLLSEASVAEILRPHFDSPGSTLGFNRSELEGREVVSKNGIFTGYHSHMIADPATGHGVYVVANAATAGRVVASLAQLALRLLWEVDSTLDESAGLTTR